MVIGDLVKCVNGKLYGDIGLDNFFNKLEINSKKVSTGDIFIAIKGKRFDGHSFIDEAFKNGAILVICEKKINGPCIVVSDTLKSLGDIAHYMIRKYNPKVIAVTGSTGKTTTKNILYNLLKSKYNVLTNEKNFNNNIGVPLTVFKLDENIDVLLLELGMNHLKEISYLSNMINPDISIITNIGSSHIGYLKSKDNILKAKLEILDGMSNKVLFVNGDDDYLKDTSSYKSGFNDYNDFTGYDIKSNLFNSSFMVNWDNKEYKVFVNLQKHLLSDVLIAMNVSLYMGIDIDSIISILKDFYPSEMRMNIFKDINNNTIIDDCYNSSFESLTGVLEVLKDEMSDKLLILGDIKELGSYSHKIHLDLIPYIDSINNKEVILVGGEMGNLDIEALRFDNYSDLLSYLKGNNICNKIVLIKGSRSMGLDNITNYFKKKL